MRVALVGPTHPYKGDGLLCAPDDVDDLTRAIRQFYAPGVAETLYANLPESSADTLWQDYIANLLSPETRS